MPLCSVAAVTQPGMSRGRSTRWWRCCLWHCAAAAAAARTSRGASGRPLQPPGPPAPLPARACARVCPRAGRPRKPRHHRRPGARPGACHRRGAAAALTGRGSGGGRGGGAAGPPRRRWGAEAAPDAAPVDATSRCCPMKALQGSGAHARCPLAGCTASLHLRLCCAGPRQRCQCMAAVVPRSWRMQCPVLPASTRAGAASRPPPVAPAEPRKQASLRGRDTDRVDVWARLSLSTQGDNDDQRGSVTQASLATTKTLGTPPLCKTRE